MVSPGCRTVLETLPDHHSPAFLPTTVPLARTTKMSFLLAALVGPPACFKYQRALLPLLKVTAAGVETCPANIKKVGRLGMSRLAPGPTSISSAADYRCS